MSFNQGATTPATYVRDTIDQFEKLSPLDEMQIPLGYLKRCVLQSAIVHRGAQNYFFLPQESGGELNDELLPSYANVHKTLVKVGNCLVFNQKIFDRNQISIMGAYEAIDKAWDTFCNPTGDQVVGFFLGVMKAILVAKNLSKTLGEPPKRLMDSFRRMVAKLGESVKFRTLEEYVKSLTKERGKSTVSLKRIRKLGRISDWNNAPSAIACIQGLEAEAQRYCTAQCSKYTTPGVDQILEQKFITIGRRYPLVHWDDSFYYLFWGSTDSSDLDLQKVGAAHFRSMTTVNSMKLIGEIRNKTELAKIFTPAMRRNWKIFSRLCFIMNPFFDKDLTENLMRKKSLAQGFDRFKDPNFVSSALVDISKKHSVFRPMADGLIWLACMYENVQLPPTLEGDQPEPQAPSRAPDIKFKLRQQVEEFVDPPAGQSMADQMRVNRVAPGAEQSKQTDDSGMLVPILILGGLVFLMSK